MRLNDVELPGEYLTEYVHFTTTNAFDILARVIHVNQRPCVILRHFDGSPVCLFSQPRLSCIT
eukprot:6767169-Pyramimonas_sp.AAC.1